MENASKWTILYFSFSHQRSIYCIYATNIHFLSSAMFLRWERFEGHPWITLLHICLSHIKPSHLACTSPDVLQSKQGHQWRWHARQQRWWNPAFTVPTGSISYAQQIPVTCARQAISISGGVLPHSLPPPSLCKCRHVCSGHGPIPLSKRVQRISYKKKKSILG